MTTLASLAFMLLLSPAAEGGEMALARMPPDVQLRVAEFLERAKEKHGADAVAELRETRAEVHDDGSAHFWFEQVHAEVPVLFAYARVHTGKTGPAYGHIKVFRGLDDVPSSATLTADDAIAVAARHLGVTSDEIDVDALDVKAAIVPRLALHDRPKRNALAWSFYLRPRNLSSIRPHQCLVNAVTGELLLAEDALAAGRITASYRRARDRAVSQQEPVF